MEKNWKELAEEYDKNDNLKRFRNLFFQGDEKLIYFDGNSLGRLPLSAKSRVEEVIEEEWGYKLIRGWNDNWWRMPARTGSLIAEIVGAKPEEVIVCDSTSVNLYKLLIAALRLNSGRKKIVSDNLMFPSDLYIIQGVIKQLAQEYELVLVESRDDISIQNDDLVKNIDNDTAVVVFSHVCFKSSFMYDMERVTAHAQQMGALVIWDLSHSTGAVPVKLNETNADMAVGCTYKYLNGGPGSPAFIYVREDLQKEIVSPIWGWIGEKDPFGFALEYRPQDGIGHFLTGTPSILSMSTLEPSIKIIQDAGINNIRAKSVKMTSFILQLFDGILRKYNFILGSPTEDENRGSHITIKHPEAFRICKALIDPEKGEYIIIPDFRPPDNIRLGMAPLYNSFSEIYYAFSEIERIVKEEVYLGYADNREGVT